jgi:hypothetical protein
MALELGQRRLHVDPIADICGDIVGAERLGRGEQGRLDGTDRVG